jgi:hypothetical protein
MPDKTPNVDGYSDNTTEEKITAGENGVPGSPDPGRAHAAKEPLSPEEYAKLKREAEEENSDNSDKS